jgi:hypothetical protein
MREHAHRHVVGDDPSLLPVFLVRVLAPAWPVGLIEGLAEAANSFIKIFSDGTSDWIGRQAACRLRLCSLGDGQDPVPDCRDGSHSARRPGDRTGWARAFVTRRAMPFWRDITMPEIRGSISASASRSRSPAGFGQLIAVALMRLSGNDFRLVFWIALAPAYLSIVVLLLAVKELPFAFDAGERRFSIMRDLWRCPPSSGG